jgi:pilus assembly protein Flp/PilA
MRKFAKSVASRFSIGSEAGVTAIEYGLLASLISVVIITAVVLIGTHLTGVFNYIAGKLTAP